jgi:hypothetical protein
MQAWTISSSETFSPAGSGTSAGFLDVEDRAALLGTPLLGPVEMGTLVAGLKLLLLVLLVLLVLVLLLLLLLVLLLLLLLLVLMLAAMATMGSTAQTSASMSSKSSSPCAGAAASFSPLPLFFGILR